MMAEGGNSMAEALTAMAEDDRRAALLTIVGENVARVVGLPASQVEPAKPLSELGLDSLMAVELAEALEQTVGRPVSVMQMIQAGSVAGVVEVVMRAFAGRAHHRDGDPGRRTRRYRQGRLRHAAERAGAKGRTDVMPVLCRHRRRRCAVA